MKTFSCAICGVRYERHKRGAKEGEYQFCPSCRPKRRMFYYNLKKEKKLDYDRNNQVVSAICSMCNTKFEKKSGRVAKYNFCENCRPGRQRFYYKNYKEEYLKNLKPQFTRHDCSTCIFGEYNKYADTKWICRESKALQCKPYAADPALWVAKV